MSACIKMQCSPLDSVQVGAIAGVGEGVEHDDEVARMHAAPVMHEVCANKSGASRDQQSTRWKAHRASSSSECATCALVEVSTPPYLAMRLSLCVGRDDIGAEVHLGAAAGELDFGFALERLQ